MLMSTEKLVSRVFLGVAVLVGLGSIVVAPSVSLAGCVIRCETCQVNLQTGEARCTNCTLTDCQPPQQ